MTSGLGSDAAAILALGTAGLAGAVLPSNGRPLNRLDRAPAARPAPRWVLLPVRLAALVPVALLVAGPLPTALGLAAVTLVRRRVARSTARLGAEQRRAALDELLAALAAELRAGADPRPAMEAAARGLPGLDPLAAAARSATGDVPHALECLAAEPGGAAAADLAAAWRVAETTGAGLVEPVERVLAAHRAWHRLRQEVAAQMAAPVATARLLAGLPVLGVVMGAALGADPVGFLTGSAAGRACLVLGLLLLLAGLRWTRSIVRSAAGPLTAPG